MLVRMLAIVVLAVLTACGPRIHTPNPDRNPFEPIPEFRSDNAVRLYNNQPSTAEVVYYDPIGVDWAGNYHVWTDAAIAIAARELRKRGLTISDDAPRALGLAVVGAKTTPTFATIETVIELDAEMDGSTHRFVGRNKSGFAALIPRQTDGALMRAVKEMLSDPAVVAYLTGSRQTAAIPQ